MTRRSPAAARRQIEEEAALAASLAAEDEEEPARAAAPVRPATAARANRRAPRCVAGPLPAPASTTGRRYYAFERGQGVKRVGPLVAVGQEVSLGLLDGRWQVAGGRHFPEGFADLDSAVNHLHALYGDKEVTLVISL